MGGGRGGASSGGGGGHPGFRGVDIAAQKRLNAEAPRIPNLGRRVIALFRPYGGRIVVTGFLVVAGAAIAVIPALIVQRIFDDALFPVDGGAPDIPLLIRLVLAMIGLFLLSAAGAASVAGAGASSLAGSDLAGSSSGDVVMECLCLVDAALAD